MLCSYADLWLLGQMVGHKNLNWGMSEEEKRINIVSRWIYFINATTND